MCARSQSERESDILQKFHSSQNGIRKVLEGINRPELFVKHFFVEHYAKGDASLILDVETIWDGNVVGKSLHSAKGSAPLDVARFVLKLDALDGGEENKWNEKPMLVHVISLVDGPNGNIPSLVGLYLVHDSPVESKAVDVYFSLPKKSFKFIHNLSHRELISHRVADRFGREHISNSPPSVVESTAHIVDSIPDKDSNVGSGLFSIAQVMLDDFVSTIRIYLDSSNVGFFQKSNSVLKIADMLIGPFELSTRTFKFSHAEKVSIGSFG